MEGELLDYENLDSLIKNSSDREFFSEVPEIQVEDNKSEDVSDLKAYLKIISSNYI